MSARRQKLQIPPYVAVGAALLLPLFWEKPTWFIAGGLVIAAVCVAVALRRPKKEMTDAERMADADRAARMVFAAGAIPALALVMALAMILLFTFLYAVAYSIH